MSNVGVGTNFCRTLSNTRNTIEEVGLELANPVPVERSTVQVGQVIVHSDTCK